MSIPNETFEFTLEQLSIGAFFILPERADDRLVVGLWLIPTIYGILANIALIFTVLKSKDLRANPSYYLLNHIAVCNLLQLLFEGFFRLGGIVFRQAYLGSAYSTANYLTNFFVQCVWWSFVFELTFTAFNRFVCIFFVGRYDTLFTRRSMQAVVCITSVAGIAMCAPHLHPCCRVLWLFDDWTNTYYPSSTWYIQFDYIVTLTTIGIIVVCYLGVGWRLRQKQSMSSGSKGRDQLRIALQVGLMCGIYTINAVLWNIIPYIAASRWVNAAFGSTTAIQCAIHPTIAFVFNSRIRKELLAVTRRVSQQPRASITTSSQGPLNPSRLTNVGSSY